MFTAQDAWLEYQMDWPSDEDSRKWLEIPEVVNFARLTFGHGFEYGQRYAREAK